MTNLTKYEIEQERKVFEAWYKKNISSDLEKDKNGLYIRFWQYDIWYSWLARAKLSRRSTSIDVGKKSIPKKIINWMFKYNLSWGYFWCEDHKDWFKFLDSQFPHRIERCQCKTCLKFKRTE